MSQAGEGELVLVGAGGTCADVLVLIGHINARGGKYRVRGVLDDSQAVGNIFCGVPVLGALSSGIRQEGVKFVDCLGSPRSFTQREDILTENGLDTVPFETIVHPSVIMAPDVMVGCGSILFPGVVLLSKVELGPHVTVLSNCVLNHGVCVEGYSILASGVNLSGQVKIGARVYLGAGSSVREGIKVGQGSLVGLGSAVVRDVPNEVIVTGNPARPMNRSA